MSKIFIGTSGWSYEHWKGVFYPEGLNKNKWLEFYCQDFNTVEINSTFYHLPREKTIVNWVKKTPEDFTFAVKASRFITHIKKLKDIKEPLERFLDITFLFGEKLGPVLFQFPPGFKKDSGQLEEFLSAFTSGGKKHLGFEKFSKTGLGGLPVTGLAAVLEFRHPSWFCDEVYNLLRKFNSALCFSDTPNYPYLEKVTADFIYLRLHGHEKLYASEYPTKQLEGYAQKITNWSKKVGNIYCYFDNDAYGLAIKNAKELKELVVEK